MKQFHAIKETPQLLRLSDDTYDEMLAALKHRNPAAQQLIEDDELSQLHDLLLLLRQGYIRIHWAETDVGDRLLMLEITTSQGASL